VITERITERFLFRVFLAVMWLLVVAPSPRRLLCLAGGHSSTATGRGAARVRRGAARYGKA
jgi:hypothetical protein